MLCVEWERGKGGVGEEEERSERGVADTGDACMDMMMPKQNKHACTSVHQHILYQREHILSKRVSVTHSISERTHSI